MACSCEVLGLACIVLFVFGLLASKAPYQLKMTIFFLASALICLLCLPFMFFRPKDHRNALVPAFVVRWTGNIIGITMELRGFENVRKNHGSVIIINHQSAIDLIVLGYLWPVIGGRPTVVAKKQILYFPFFGIGSYLWGTLFINRSRTADSVQSLKKESKAINERNCKLLLFPEGTRHQGDNLLQFKKGAFHIAVENQCPIQPVVCSRYHHINSKSKLFGRGRSIVHILPEISTVGYTKENMQDLIDKCHRIMQNEYTKLSEETKGDIKKKTP